jgi:hypothetical protein
MNIVRCPRCQDDVTVPLRASPKALVRCPLCLEEYTLAEALGGLPPALVVLDGSDMVEESALFGAGVAQAGLDRAGFGGGDEYRLSSGGYGPALEAGGPGDAIAAPRPVVKGTRPKKKEKNGFVELLKIVLGGLVGLSLGYFVLLWGFSMDVLGLAPKMSRYAPWIVPARFHGEPSASSTASTSGGALDTSGDSSPSTSSGANADGNQRRQQGAMEPVGEGVAPSSAADIEVPGPTLAESDAAGGLGGVAVEPELKPIPLPEPDLGPLLPEANPKATTPAEPAEPALPEPKPQRTSAPQPETSPLPTATELSKAVLAASAGTTKINEATGQPPEVRRQLFIDLYGSASEVGRLLSQLDSASPEFAEDVAEVKTALASLAVQPGKLSALKALTDINLPERKHGDGVLVAGVVQEFAPAGTYHAGTFRAGKSGTEVVIASASELKEAFSPGDELLLVGRVVDDPAKNLPGYAGDVPRVVLLGIAVPVPKTE